MKSPRKQSSTVSPLWLISFIVYFVALILFVILKFRGSIYDIVLNVDLNLYNRQFGKLNVNLVPFKTIVQYMSQMRYGYALLNIFGNIIPFAPMGYFLAIKFTRKPFIKTIICCFSIIFVFEMVQFFTLIGVFDIDDLILNMLGCILGYFAYCASLMVIKKVKYSSKAEKPRNS